MGAGHLAVPYQEAGCGQSGQTASDDIGAFSLHALRLLRAGKSLIVAAGVIDALAVFFVAAQFRIAVIIGDGLGTRRCFLGLCQFLSGHDHHAGASQAGSCGRQLSKILCH